MPGFDKTGPRGQGPGTGGGFGPCADATATDNNLRELSRMGRAGRRRGGGRGRCFRGGFQNGDMSPQYSGEDEKNGYVDLGSQIAQLLNSVEELRLELEELKSK